MRRSGDKERRKETYSGKKKRHTFNTTIVSATNNIIKELKEFWESAAPSLERPMT